MPLLPNFNDVNVNNWFQSIETDPRAWEQFAIDMESDFLGAIQIRFSVNQAQINFINQLMESQKDIIKCIIRKLANYLKFDTYPGKKVHATTLGIVETPPQTANNINVDVKAGIKKNFNTGATEGYLEIIIHC